MSTEGPRWFVGGVLLALLMSVSPARGRATQGERASTDESLVQWINSTRHPLTTTDPAVPLDDLAPLTAIVGQSEIVGLGEATHGSSEIWRVRHRIVRYLVEQLGFTGFVLEAPWPVGPLLDDHVLHGYGDLPTILADAFPYNSHEMRDLFAWMRAHNADPRHATKVRVAAMDIQRLAPEMFDRVTNYVRAGAPDRVLKVQQAYAPLRARVLEALRAGGSAPKSYESLPAATKAEYANQAKEVEDLLRRHERAMVARSSRDAFDSALERAQVIAQYTRFGDLAEADRPAALTFREQSMAANAAWWHNHVGRTVVWAHDSHVAKRTMMPQYYTEQMMGTFLRQRYGELYLSIGSSFGQGAYTAIKLLPGGGSTNEIITITIRAPLPNSLNAVLNRARSDRYILDLRPAPDSIRTWLQLPRAFQVGLAAAADDPKWVADNTPDGTVGEWFDVLIHLRQVSAGHPASATPR